ncbi:hypothetical protein [Lentilactobacillus kisonensis]|uniref:Lipoprotein n=1 Tax=Lentilactobacillus kisonensis F0435 TaxID=797516 RepID=H1LI81_9LACO|nr:hypothetical protein [Lentilactobacillus kisonensis]EHO49914.1 hypothetical protein HMPREF9104_02322 [Lentilactobacillus kisonensis F0435]
MKKIISLLFAAASLTLFLSGCGKPTLTVSDHHLSANALAVTVKGKSNQDKVHYAINGGPKKSAKTQNGAFVISVPTKDYRQTVKLTADGKHQTVQVARAKVIASYSKVRASYNQALTGSALSKKDQKLAMGLAKQGAQLKKESQALKANKSTSMAAMQQKAKQAAALQQQAQQLKQTQAQLPPAMKRAKASVADQLLPAKPKNGISNLISSHKMTLRANLHDGKTLGIAMMVPVSSLKHKRDLKPFIMSFSILADSVGANAKHVLKDFQKSAKAKKSSSTTAPTFHSNGIQFSLGYSTTTLYVFITK